MILRLQLFISFSLTYQKSIATSNIATTPKPLSQSTCFIELWSQISNFPHNICTSVTHRHFRFNEPDSLSFPPIPCLTATPLSQLVNWAIILDSFLLSTVSQQQVLQNLTSGHLLLLLCFPHLYCHRCHLHPGPGHLPFHYRNCPLSGSLPPISPLLIHPPDCRSNLYEMKTWASFSSVKPFDESSLHTGKEQAS